MLQPFPILVAQDDTHVDVTVPFVTSRAFTGRSQSRVYDDAALHLMECVFGANQEELPRYLFAPDTSLRRVKVRVTFRDEQEWKGRLSVALRRWPDEKHLEASIPRLGVARFAVTGTKDLPDTIARHLRELGGKDATKLIGRLHGTQRYKNEHLDWIEVDLELPTVLPRTAKARRRRKIEEEDDAVERAKSRAQRRRETPPITLREVGVNLVNRVLDGDTPAVLGRDALVDYVAARVRRPGAAVLLVGPSGVGKTALLEAVIAKLTEEEDRLHARRDAWLVDANRIIAGMSFVGQWEGRVEQMVHELSQRGDILVVDDLPALAFAGRTSHEETNVAAFLDPHVAQGELRVLAECTAERLEACRDEAPSFFSRFHVVQVEPLDEATTLRVLVSRVRAMEGAWLAAPPARRFRFAVETPEAVLGLSRRFHRRDALPGSAVRLLEQLGTEAPTELTDEGEPRPLDAAALVRLFSEKTGLPPFVLWEDQGRSHEQVREHFARRIVAQDAAVDAVASVVTVLQQGLGDPSKPIASMLLVGPTGVGKTETAKALAGYLFGSERRLLRFDMSELADAGAAARLFGDLSRPDGELTRQVRRQPFAVVLFDEVEKAHPTVFDALLGLLGEGRLTSASGVTTDFTNTVILMTSNLGVRDAESMIGFEGGEAPDRTAHYVGAARGFFRPEFFNRIDRVVAYRSLGRDAVRPLVERALASLTSRRGLRRAGVLVDVDDTLIDVLGDRGFDARYGARALKREVEQRIAVPLARRLVDAPPDSTTLVSLFREGADIGMDVWPLEAPPDVAVDEPAITSFEALQARYDETRGWLNAREATIELARDELSRELARRNRGVLEDTTRLDVLAELTDELRAVEDELETFRDDVLAGRRYVARVTKAHEARDEWRQIIKTETVVEEQLMVRAVKRPAPADVTELERVRRRLAALLFRLKALEGDREQVLVRVLPATRSDESMRVAGSLDQAIGRALSTVGYATGIWRVAREDREPTWRAVTDMEADELTSPITGFAQAIDGFGVTRALEPLLGFHLETRFDGPDVLTGIARVELVPWSDPPAEALDSLDAAYAAFLDRRQRGEPGPHPRGPLPVKSHSVGGAEVQRWAEGALVRHALEELS